MTYLPFAPTFAVIPMKRSHSVHAEGAIYMFKPGSNPAQILQDFNIDTTPPKGCRHGPLDLEGMVVLPDNVEDTEFEHPLKVRLNAHKALASGELLQKFYESDAVTICLGTYRILPKHP